MSRLKSIASGKLVRPPRVILYGVHGIGKSTFPSNKKFKPIFLQTEDGLDNLDVDRFPLAESWDDVMLNVSSLLNEEHDYKTLVIDTLDWAERLLHTKIAFDAGKNDISDIPYGQGYSHAVSHLNKLLNDLNELRDKKKMAIVCLAHSQINRFETPLCEPYDRYSLAMHKKGARIVEEWADMVLFVNYKTMLKKTEGDFGRTSVKGVGTGERTLYTEERPAFHAKNRYGLEPEMDFDFNAVLDGIFKKGK